MASTFVTLSWNTSGALSTGRGYILQVKRAYPASILAAASAPQASNSKDAGASGRQTTGTSKASQGMFMELRNTKKVYPAFENLFHVCLVWGSQKYTVVNKITMNQIQIFCQN